MEAKVKTPVDNEMNTQRLLELNEKVSHAEQIAQKHMRMRTEIMRDLLNYIFDLEQDLRWNTSKYGVTPPLMPGESDGRLENL